MAWSGQGTGISKEQHYSEFNYKGLENVGVSGDRGNSRLLDQEAGSERLALRGPD